MIFSMAILIFACRVRPLPAGSKSPCTSQYNIKEDSRACYWQSYMTHQYKAMHPPSAEIFRQEFLRATDLPSLYPLPQQHGSLMTKIERRDPLSDQTGRPPSESASSTIPRASPNTSVTLISRPTSKTYKKHHNHATKKLSKLGASSKHTKGAKK